MISLIVVSALSLISLLDNWFFTQFRTLVYRAFMHKPIHKHVPISSMIKIYIFIKHTYQLRQHIAQKIYFKRNRYIKLDFMLSQGIYVHMYRGTSTTCNEIGEMDNLINHCHWLRIFFAVPLTFHCCGSFHHIWGDVFCGLRTLQPF